MNLDNSTNTQSILISYLPGPNFSPFWSTARQFRATRLFKIENVLNDLRPTLNVCLSKLPVAFTICSTSSRFPGTKLPKMENAPSDISLTLNI